MPKKAAKHHKSKPAAPVKTARQPVAKKAPTPASAAKKSAKAKPARARKSAPAKTAAKTAGKNNPSAAARSGATVKVFGKPPFPIKSAKTALTAAASTAVKPGKRRHLGAKFLAQQKKKLVELREHMLEQMQGVTQTNLRSPGDDAQVSAFGMHQADAGSDAYEKDFALNLLSQEQDALYEINSAIKRIEDGTYGSCEMSGQPIPVSRLEAIPFARFTIKCQSQLEQEQKGRARWDTSAQFMDSVETFYEEEEAEEEDTDKAKLKE
ncbi:MAG: TraR/DksA C4-type zinc finger protein [Verrucomicrobiales bacterium]|jgi:RNA polymerase-binding transcription factor DksA|nr:TraR/DksA C4-type zinc finger protein [Verrucomicrobiales bacterium]